MFTGIVEEMGTLLIPPTYKSAVGFFLIVLVLLVRPTGLAGPRT